MATMFVELAIAAIGVGVVVMVGYLVVAQVASSLNSSTTDAATQTSLASTKTIVYSGFGLLAVGIIVLAAFGLISVFQ